MANKVTNVLIKLKDKFSGPLKKTTETTKKAKREIAAANKTINKFASNANKKFKSIAATAAKTLGGMSVAALTAGTVTGFSEAFNLETYRAQLETATGDTQKAADIMKYAINLANKTPFEGGELVEAASKFEAMGMSAEYWLTKAGDMAGATGKDIIQATEAIIDAQSGEWERMKEFGIKGVKDMDELVGIMDKRFAGGMEKLSKTTKGMWSTVTGVTKNALANIVGVMNDGTIKAGSPLDVLRGYIQKLADKLVELQNNGTIQKLSDMVANGLAKAMDALGRAVDFVSQNANWLVPVLTGLITVFTSFNIIHSVVTKITALKSTFDILSTGAKAAGGAIKLLCSGSGIGMIAIAIGAAIAAGVYLYKNWDTIKQRASDFVAAVKADFELIRDNIVNAFTAVKDRIAGVFNWIKEKLSGIKSSISNLPIVGKLFGGGTSTDGHATGSAYFSGGLTRVNEGGRGELINLPNGSQIIPHNKSEKILSAANGTNINLNLTIQGNVIGNEAYADYLGGFISKRIIAAINNI